MIRGLYAILDLPHAGGVAPARALEAMLDGGAAVVQLRSKQARLDQDRDRDRGLVAELGRLCSDRGVALILNDDLELALAQLPGVAGVHLGQGDLGRLGADPASRRRARDQLRARGLMLGVSTHVPAQVEGAIAELSPDYLGYGPVFMTATKANPEPVVGLDGLALACAAAARSRPPVPVVAIGGIDLGRVPEVMARGPAAIAMIGALVATTPEEIRERCLAVHQLIQMP